MSPQKRDMPSMSFRLSEEAQKLLKALSQSEGMSMTAILELLIREWAEKKGIR